jgi:glycosyltransferase involved in cell wall biosynthesis
VIPVWDRYAGPRLKEALDSLTSQDPRPRILLVDNASTAPVPALIDDEVIRSPVRVTLGAARNLGLGRVRTENVIFWDADDVMEPGTLVFIEDRLAQDPRLVAFGAGIVEDPSGQRHRWPREWIAWLLAYPRLFALINASWSMYPTTGATIMRTAVVSACGGFADAESGDDWSLGAALAFRGRFGWSERTGRRYLQHEGSIWDTYSSPKHQLVHAAAIRARLAHDDAVPRWVRRSMRLVALAQWAAVGAHLGAASLRSRVDRKRSSAAA